MTASKAVTQLAPTLSQLALTSPLNSHGLSIVGGKLQADIATETTLGTVKIGDGIDVDASGEISVDLSGLDVNADLEYVPDGNNAAEITNTAGDNATVPLQFRWQRWDYPAGLFIRWLEKDKACWH